MWPYAAEGIGVTTGLRYDGAPERRDWILEALRSARFLSVSDMSRELGVSDMTVRRDLRKLEEVGEVRTVHGGASLPHGAPQASTFGARAALNADGKSRIAAVAGGLVGPADTVAVDAGTTAYELASTLPSTYSGCVITHSVPVIQLMLSRPGTRVVGLGGELYHDSQTFVGPMTVDAASGVRVRTFFLGAAALDERGVYVATDVERPTKQALMDIADEVVLLADSDKLATSAPVLLCPLDRLTALVTDREPPAPFVDRLRAGDVRLHVAGPADAR